jgi:haloacetate dehalogenase
MDDLFPGFDTDEVATTGARIHLRRGGSGPPVLLLHGHPETHAMWHRVAPRLAQDFTVVAADLRGYGDSSKPVSAPDHEPYSKRAMAGDMLEVMSSLGFERFSIVGHDRGGRVAYRAALDHPDRVERLAVLDIVPTVEMWNRMDARLALENWHWLFMAQPEPFPERLIRHDVDSYYFRDRRERFDPRALEQYFRALHDAETIHAICEDYRAGATYDRDLDARDRATGRRISSPVLVLWSALEDIEPLDPISIWRAWADDVSGRGLECGHFLAEERPGETYDALRQFLDDHERGDLRDSSPGG